MKRIIEKLRFFYKRWRDNPRNRYHAEDGVDKFVRNKFFPDYCYRGTFVEVGGATPEYLSMSKHFRDTGWRCIVIEPNPTFASFHREAGNEIVECACSFEDLDSADFKIVNWLNVEKVTLQNLSEHSFSSLEPKREYLEKNNYKSLQELKHRTVQVRVRTLKSILQELQISKIDILSVDVEGWELEVLGGLDLARHRPKIIILEDYLNKVEYGNYMRKFDYKEVHSIRHNQIFLKT